MQQYSFLLHGGDCSAENCGALVEASIRNKLADDELVFYERERTFLGKHGLVVQRNAEQRIYRELYDMKLNNPEQFINAIANTEQNIRRISSKLGKGKYRSEDERAAWENNLILAQARKKLIARLISEKNTDAGD